MNAITGLHGVAAVAVICGLLFVDEAGLPLPLAPGEVLLLVVGLLIASDTVPAWVFVPAAAIAMTAGVVAGYSWARAVGGATLSRLAERVGALDAYGRASERVASASAVGIGLARMVPGIRPYITLVAGATELNVKTFMLGALPALAVWEAFWIGAGMLVGLPAAHYLKHAEAVIFRGGLLLVVGIVAYIALRRATADLEIPARWVPVHGRAILAGAVDGGMIACIASGLLAIARALFGIRINRWIDVLLVAAVVCAYLFLKPDRPRVTANGVLLRDPSP